MRNLLVTCFGRNVWRGKELKKVIYEFISKIWEKEVVPHEWKCGVICPIHKCDYYRAVTLLCTTYKIVANIYMKN
jgi:hypothetical protein